ncbi:SpoIIIAH-like family protein [Paenibacillus chartarius]|uniref:SpoIIIAH-like family protein n=1 Tax=Paenibacillus chartarius TaxID=747481 RepID=A0ABV6DNN7_9BACL
MNAKRQTIWLVSMLSLMVVLSAYYLFTEDTATVDLTTAGTAIEGAASTPVTLDLKDPTAAKVDSKDAAKVEVKPDPAHPTTPAGATTTDSKATDAKTPAAGTNGTDKATSGGTDASKTTAQTDAQILDKMTTAALSGSDFFIEQQMKRTEEFSKLTEDLIAITGDSKKSTQEVEKAFNEIDKLQKLSTSMMTLEDQLKKDFPQAVVMKDGNQFKISVQAEKLERTQAVTIIDLAMKELNVSQDKVIVQYLP